MTRASWCRRVLALVPALLLVATGSSAQTGQPITIGGVWDLTGPSSAGNGQVARRAIELRVEQVNKAGGINGRPIHLVVEDEKGQPTEAVAAVNKLINQDKVDALVGFTTSGSGQGAMPIIERSGIPWVGGVSAAVFSTPPWAS
ncbi:MAG: ABC transporter substrate-binding protein [Candidatus Rokubacteria bacterium]|nr:ABC transporter substrate-binding protein [Candidatus Rokubacteria bacterium]